MHLDKMGDITIIVVGTFMHLQRLSPFTANNPSAVVLVPNAASTLLAVSLLVALSKWRPIRGPPGLTVTLTQGLIRLLMELLTITFMVEFLLVWLWIPMLMALTELCEWIHEGLLEVYFPTFADLINHRYYTFRFVLSSSLSTAIIYTQRWLTRNDGQITEQEVEPERCHISRSAWNRRTFTRRCHKSTQTTNVGRFTIHQVTETESNV